MKIEHPTVEQQDGPTGGTVTKHPAFAQIGASRVSGGKRLYGSEFQHQNYVCIRIHPSEMHRTLSNEWAFARNIPYIEVALSEAQWATFVSSMNVGHGVQCTLQYKDGQSIPQLPDPKPQREHFKEDVKTAFEKGLGRLDETKAMIEGMKISQKAKDELVKQLGLVAQAMTSNLPFVLDQFDQHMETTVEKAKVEINAYATGAIMRAGIKALGGENGEVPLLTLKENDDAG